MLFFFFFPECCASVEAPHAFRARVQVGRVTSGPSGTWRTPCRTHAMHEPPPISPHIHTLITVRGVFCKAPHQAPPPQHEQRRAADCRQPPRPSSQHSAAHSAAHSAGAQSAGAPGWCTHAVRRLSPRYHNMQHYSSPTPKKCQLVRLQRSTSAVARPTHSAVRARPAHSGRPLQSPQVRFPPPPRRPPRHRWRHATPRRGACRRCRGCRCRLHGRGRRRAPARRRAARAAR